jgi:hypothetical protein
VKSKSRKTFLESFCAIDQLIRGNREACEATLRELIAFPEAQITEQRARGWKERTADEGARLTYPKEACSRTSRVSFYSVASRVLGRDREASERMARAIELLRAKGIHARSAIPLKEE